MARWREGLNVAGECRALRLGVWQCPPVLFILMGGLTIASMVATYLAAERIIEEPEIAALVVIFVAALFLIVGNLVITGFNKVAEANRTKSEFVSIISHQLGTPLSIFRMTLGLMEQEAAGDSRQDRGFSQNIQTLTDTADRMIRLVRSLLEVSRIEASRLTLNKKPFALDEMTEKIIEGFRRYGEANNVRIHGEISRPVPLADADPERIEMAVQNLLDNAVRYSSAGGDVLVAVGAEKGMVRWSVRNHGSGIPRDEQRYIFQKFFRAANAALRDTRGSGIGLYIAKAIVEASGGHIGFTSEEGTGATFWFTLPVAR